MHLVHIRNRRLTLCLSGHIGCNSTKWVHQPRRRWYAVHCWTAGRSGGPKGCPQPLEEPLWLPAHSWHRFGSARRRRSHTDYLKKVFKSTHIETYSLVHIAPYSNELGAIQQRVSQPQASFPSSFPCGRHLAPRWEAEKSEAQRLRYDVVHRNGESFLSEMSQGDGYLNNKHNVLTLINASNARPVSSTSYRWIFK